MKNKMRRSVVLLAVGLMGVCNALAVSTKQLQINLKNNASPICFNRADVTSISFPTVFIPEVNVQESNVTLADDNTISVKGTADSESVDNLTYGICYSSTNTTPTVDDTTISAETVTVGGEYTLSIAGDKLESNTTYYIRPFATMTTNSTSVYYGEKVFAVKTNNLVDLREVDLGLSVNWASVNIGSATEDVAGGFYAWGELNTKSSTYDWIHYEYSDSSDDGYLTKYCNNSDKGYNGYTDDKLVLDDADDCAMQHADWGTGWRMPTEKEVQELIDNTICEYALENGNKVFKFTANGNTIVMPASGVKYDNASSSSGFIYMWTKTLNEDDCQYAKALYVNYISTKETVRIFIDNAKRCWGMAIRPVRDKKK